MKITFLVPECAEEALEISKKKSMRPPTLEDIKTWSTTPIATILRPITKEDGTTEFEENWQRQVSGKGCIEILEGSPTKYHLRYERANSLCLVGVEE